MELNEILTIAVKARGSDIHIKAGLPPVVRIDGALRPIPNAPRLAPEQVQAMATAIMNDRQRQQFQHESDVTACRACDFRVNVFPTWNCGHGFSSYRLWRPTLLKPLIMPPSLQKLCLDERRPDTGYRNHRQW